MPRFEPFRGIRYDLDVLDPARVTAPPYDVISPADREALLAEAPENVVRIDLPVADPERPDADPYAVAAELFETWRRDGVLVDDPVPSFTVYRMEAPDEDGVVRHGNWHVMQHVPELTVCGECFDEVVRPRLDADNAVARSFFVKPQRLDAASCQLYSERMRDVFRRACRRDDFQYLEDKVLERRRVEKDIHAKIAALDKRGQNDAETEEEVSKLIREWQKWE